MVVRLARPDDSGAIAAIYAPYVTATAISFETVAPDAAEIRARMERIAPTHPWIVAVRDAQILGYAYASQHKERAAYRWCVDVAIYLREDAQGKGLGRQLYECLFEMLMVQNFVTAFAGITLPNAASQRLHEAMGFLPIGIHRNTGFKFRRWHDVGWWQRPLRPVAADPIEPVPISALSPDQLRLCGLAV